MSGAHGGAAARPSLIAAAVGLAVLVALALLAVWWGPGGGDPDPPPGEAVVVRVVDGDTVVVAVGGAEESVRLIGIDTPESVARDRPDECFGAEAAQRLAELLPPGTVVRLTRDVEPRDVYDRLLAYVQREPDGLFVNAAQVGDGYAVAKDYPPNTTYRADLERAERAARAAGRGLWPACGGADAPLAGAAPGP
ncbi:MAG TPA: thermonuclease family protein [Acidimicrobiales bacterium]|nr:thermonuclease family protein [Acidimicrobiales bacterium]